MSNTNCKAINIKIIHIRLLFSIGYTCIHRKLVISNLICHQLLFLLILNFLIFDFNIINIDIQINIIIFI